MSGKRIKTAEAAHVPATLSWHGDAATGLLRLIDQTQLPVTLVEIDCETV
ncbi:MAG: hypothetical protein IH899_21895, partial [Planctomycetes bacterium]|nr:hypothetical protein [Planctomycetota bacterium]